MSKGSVVRAAYARRQFRMLLNIHFRKCLSLKVLRRVAVEIVGLIPPVTDKGNRYILTLVDFASRYPETIPTAPIDTERVAEAALLEIFSIMEIPEKILSDMVTQFTSIMMSELVVCFQLDRKRPPLIIS